MLMIPRFAFKVINRSLCGVSRELSLNCHSFSLYSVRYHDSLLEIPSKRVSVKLFIVHHLRSSNQSFPLKFPIFRSGSQVFRARAHRAKSSRHVGEPKIFSPHQGLPGLLLREQGSGKRGRHVSGVEAKLFTPMQESMRVVVHIPLTQKLFSREIWYPGNEVGLSQFDKLSWLCICCIEIIRENTDRDRM